MTIRTEKDVLGPVQVPADRLWGAQTQRCLNNFKIGHDTLPESLIKALCLIKQACARVNHQNGRLDETIAQAIDHAAQSIINGDHLDHFPVPPWQTGSGTQANMNANEVIANLANRNLGHPIGQKHPVHPNDHVNLGQSSNDTFPSAMHIAFVRDVTEKLLPALDHIVECLEQKQMEFKDLIKIGRTHFQDATPLRVGQEIGAWKHQIADARLRIEKNLDAAYQLAQGGTAVGTGLNTPEGFDQAICDEIAKITGLPFCPREDKFSGLAAHDVLIGASGDLNQLAVALLKITNDIKILSSGPRAGLSEITLPANEPGSSIMPGKINPTQAEALAMVALQVMGYHHTITIAGSQGQLQLNVFKPVIIQNLLNAIEILSSGLMSFTDNCLSGLAYDHDHLNSMQERSLMLVTALAPVIGYDKCAEIARKAHQEKTTLKDAALSLGHISAEDFDTYVRADLMLEPTPR